MELSYTDKLRLYSSLKMDTIKKLDTVSNNLTLNNDKLEFEELEVMIECANDNIKLLEKLQDEGWNL